MRHLAFLLGLAACAPSEAMHVRIEAGPAAEEVIRANLDAAEDVLGIEIVETDRDWGSVEVYYREPDYYAGIAHEPDWWEPGDWCKRRVGVGFSAAVLAHELGHAFELGHTGAFPDSTENVMYPAYMGQDVEELWLSDAQWSELVGNVARFNLDCARR